MIALGIAALGFILTLALQMLVVSILLYLVFYVGFPALSRLHTKASNFRRASRE